jgi:hypothetical protein
VQCTVLHLLQDGHGLGLGHLPVMHAVTRSSCEIWTAYQSTACRSSDLTILHDCSDHRLQVERVVSEADGYRPHLVAPEMGYRRLLQSCLTKFKVCTCQNIDTGFQADYKLAILVSNCSKLFKQYTSQREEESLAVHAAETQLCETCLHGSWHNCLPACLHPSLVGQTPRGSANLHMVKNVQQGGQNCCQDQERPGVNVLQFAAPELCTVRTAAVDPSR